MSVFVDQNGAKPIYGTNLWKSSSLEPRAPGGWIFAQIIGDGYSTIVAKIMVVRWRLTFSRKGHVGKMFKISSDFSPETAGPMFLKFHVKPPRDGMGVGGEPKDC